MNRENVIKKMCIEGKSLKNISETLKINYETVRSICKRNNFTYELGKKGRKLESYDKNPRKKKSKKKIKISGGDDKEVDIVNPSSINNELKELLEQVYS